MGGGKIEKAICELEKGIAGCEDIEVIAVCGSNKELYDRLCARGSSKVIPVGYTEDMASYMRAAHLFITKPGGLSSTEAAVCGVPILHAGAIPGCETLNANYFSSHGMSVACDFSENISKTACKLLYDDGACEQMISMQKRFINRNAAAQICDFAEELAIENAYY